MPRAGRAIRQAAQHEAANARLCGCGARCDEHRNLPYGSPRYDPGKFPCVRTGCDDFHPKRSHR